MSQAIFDKPDLISKFHSSAKLLLIILFIAIFAVIGVKFIKGSKAESSVNTGAINLILATGPQSDQYTNCTWNSNTNTCSPTPYASWYKQNFYRASAFDPYWTNQLGLNWFPNTWFYDDSFAVYTNCAPGMPCAPNSSESPQTAWILSHHPEWILKSASGQNLFINWGCSNGTCPQYAADFSNPGFVHYWLTGCDLNNPQQCDGTGGAEATLNKGYKGIMIDDVNMDPDISDGSNTVLPIDKNTGQTITVSNWRKYFANYMLTVRQAMPNAEIVHNAVWYDGGGYANSNPDLQYLKEEIQSANYISDERGIVDSGLTGDGGQWSVQNLFGYNDFVHSLCALNGSGQCSSTNVHVWYASYADNSGNPGVECTPNCNEYNLAGYLLTSDGYDGVSSDAASELPTNLWAGYKRNLGPDNGIRYSWDGLIRRDFQNGVVLLNPPGNGSAITVNLGGQYQEINNSNQVVNLSSVTINPGNGYVLTSEVNKNPLSVSITSPINNSTITSTTNIESNVTSSNPIISVQFKLDNNNLGSPVTSPSAGSNYIYSFNSSSVSNGEHTLSAVVTDNQGNTATSSSISVNVSNTNPKQPPSQPTDLTANPVSSSQINLNWSASQAVNGLAGYYIYRNGSSSPVATLTSTSYGDNNLVANTKYSYYVIAFDKLGNVSSPSATVSATTFSPNKTLVSLSGQVLDSSTHQPIPNALISTGIHATPTGSTSTSTNSQGQFILTNIISNVNHDYYVKATNYINKSFILKISSNTSSYIVNLIWN